MGSFARGCVSPVAISGRTSSRPARTGVFSAASRASSRRRTPSVFSPTGALPSGAALVRCRGKGGRPAMAVTTGRQGRTFACPEPASLHRSPRGEPRAQRPMLSSRMPKYLPLVQRSPAMSESELERELHRRGQGGKLLQGHRDQRSPKESSGRGHQRCECSEHESPAETASTMQVVGLHDGLHARCRALPERYLARCAAADDRDRLAGTTGGSHRGTDIIHVAAATSVVRCSSPFDACRHLVRDPMGVDRRSAAASASPQP